MSNILCGMNSENYLFKYYEKQYYHEIELREKFVTKIQLFVVILISVISLHGYLFFDGTIPSDVARVVFILFTAISSLFLLYSGYCFFKALSSYTYAFLPYSENVDGYDTILKNFYEARDDCDVVVEKALSQYLCSAYIKASTCNAKNNEKRSGYLFRLTNSVLVCVCFSAGAFLLKKLCN